MFTSRGSTSMFTSGGPLPCSFLGRFTSMFTSRGPLSCSPPGGPLSCSPPGVHFHVHFWGGPLPCSLLGGPLPCSLLKGSTSGGVPCNLSHNALIYHYRMPQCIMDKIHMGPPPHRVEQTDRQTLLKTLPSHTTLQVIKMSHI